MPTSSSAQSVPDSVDRATKQGGARATGALGEIIVTAQKYRQSALDVPISLVVIGSVELRREHVRNLHDLQFDVPGLRVQGGGAQQRIVIRGVGNDFGNGPYVSEYIDDADVTGSGYSGAAGYGGTVLQTYDLARVEVLRGPQGTLYGDSALGGTIRLITNKPVLDRFEMSSGVELPFTQYGSPSQHVESMVNVPLARTLALRVAGQFVHDGGWIDQPAGNAKNINDRNSTDVRIQGLWEPILDLQVRAMQIIHRETYGLNQGEDVQGNFTQPFNVTTIPNAQRSFGLSNLRVTYRVGRIRILSSSTYLSSGEDLRNYSDNETGVAASLITNARNSEEKITQEIRVARAGAGPWRWTFGGFYGHDRSRLSNGAEYFGLYSLPITLESLANAFYSPGNHLSQGSNSWAIFGDTSYALTNRLSLGAGARYYRDRESADGYPNSPNRATFTSTDPRAYLQYRIARHTNLYMSAAKGFRSGGFNPFTRPYGPESLWSYEFGAKAAGNRWAANADVFWSDYSNYLGSAIVVSASPEPEDYNIGRARIRGVEGEVEWRPNIRWLLKVGGELNDARIVSIASSAFYSFYKVGDRVPLSSRYQLSAFVERTVRWHHRSGYIRASMAQLGPQVDYGPFESSDRIRMLGIDAGIQCSDSLNFGVFAQNLLNDRGQLDPYGKLGIASRPRPRTFGIDFRVTFGGRS